MSAETEKAGAAILRRSVIGELLATHQDDVRYRSQALDIINDGRTAPEPDHCREGWADTRHAALALQGFHERRLFPDFIRAGTGVPVAIKLLAGAKDVVAEEALSVGIVDRLLHDGEQIAVFAADIDISLLRADGEAGDNHALDDGVRILLEDEAVFAGAGFGLVPIDQNVFRLGCFFGNEAPFHASREAGAAAPAKVGGFDLVDDRVRSHLQSFFDGLVAVELEIGVDVGRTFAEPLRNDSDLVGMLSQIRHYCFAFERYVSKTLSMAAGVRFSWKS